MQKDLFGDAVETTIFDKVQQYIRDRDEFNFTDKVERLKYLHKLNPDGFSMMGQTELVLTMREVQLCFIDGHYLATVLLAQAFVEKVLHVHYIDLGSESVAKKGFAAILEHAAKNMTLNGYVISKANAIRLIRNPITHVKAPTYEHGLDQRSIRNRVSPLYQLQMDAKEAIEIATFIALANLKRLI